MSIDTTFVEHNLDKMWSALVAHRFDQRCVMCGKPGCDSHHWFFPRSYHKYRWCVNNGVYMCRKDHSKSELDNGKSLLVIINKYYPRLITWSQERPPEKPEPVTLDGLMFLEESLSRSVASLGITIKLEHPKSQARLL